MKVKEALKKARDLISKSENWTRYAYARDADGNSVTCDDSKAVCFCALGAILKVTGGGDGSDDAYWLCRDKLLASLLDMGSGIIHVPSFNDNQTHEKVLDLFDRAIASCQ